MKEQANNKQKSGKRKEKERVFNIAIYKRDTKHYIYIKLRSKIYKENGESKWEI